MRQGLRWAVLVGGLVLGSMAFAAEEGWTPLFDGKDLEGWKNPDPAKFFVEDGCIVGTQNDGKGADLFTQESYDNFELRFTYKVKWPANSGIWYRNSYQFDILKYTSPKTFSGALYPGQGKTFAFVNLDESIEKADDWNDGVVYANGDHLIHWLNGKEIGETHDKRFAKGRIGIQVHPGGGMKGMKIIIKRIELRPLKEGDKPSLPVSAPEAKQAGDAVHRALDSLKE